MRTDVVDTELLHQLYAFLDGSWVGCCTEGTEGVVVGIALQQHFPAVELQTECRADFNGADTKQVGYLIGHATVLS